MLQHVKSQVEEAHWPIFCPMCPPQEEHRGSEYRDEVASFISTNTTNHFSRYKTNSRACRR
jgi:hypothetical protein